MDEQQFEAHLYAKRDEYLGVLEQLFGPRDSRFPLGVVGESRDDNPRTHFPVRRYDPSGCTVDVHVGGSAWRDQDKQRATWQMAHECVHLLDPKPFKPYGNVLEEGLATCSSARRSTTSRGCICTWPAIRTS